MNSRLSTCDISIEVSKLGAELTSLEFSGKEFLYQKTPGFWQRQSPVLFPIVGALKDGCFEYEGQQYPLPQHGFARDREFSCILQDDKTLTFELLSDGETQKVYPFSWKLRISYTVEGKSLLLHYEVENTGTHMMYYSLGAHPAFVLEGQGYALEGDKEQTELLCQRLEGGLRASTQKLPVQGKKLLIEEHLFEQDACIFPQKPSQNFTLSQDGKKLFTFDTGNFPSFGIWKQKQAPFVCLEPWAGLADSIHHSQNLREKQGIQSLVSGGIHRWFWSLHF